MKKTFRYKLFIVLTAVLLISTFSVSYIWYTKSKKIITDEVLKATKTLVDERNRNLENAIKDLDYISISIASSNIKVSRVINNKWEDPYLRIQAEKNIQQYMDNLYSSKEYISTIIISNGRGDIYKRGSSIDDDFVLKQSFYKKLQDNPSGRVIVPYYYEQENIKEIFIIRNIFYNENIIGYCIVGMQYDYLKEIFDKALPQNSMLVINNEEGNIIFKNSDNLEKELLKEIDSIKIDDNGYKISRILGESYLVIKFKSYYTNFNLIGVIHTKDMFYDIQKTLNSIIAFIIPGLILLVLLANIISKEISKNIQVLSKGMKAFSEGDLEAKVSIKSEDELKLLGDSFNDMTQKIKELLEDIKENEKEKVELEIKALQGQINLHFLFNTLNTIKDLCYIQRVTNVEKLVSSLMELLHISMAKDEGRITLRKEIEYIQHYLEIYKYKHLNNIECFINIDEEILDCLVLKFILQPIVENSIIHGLDGITEDRNGIIYIKGKREADNVKITVIDNGEGFDMEHNNKKLNGIGIANIDKRIKMNFGAEYGVKISSIINTSTTVEIIIPYIKVMNND